MPLHVHEPFPSIVVPGTVLSTTKHFEAGVEGPLVFGVRGGADGAEVFGFRPDEHLEKGWVERSVFRFNLSQMLLRLPTQELLSQVCKAGSSESGITWKKLEYF